MNRKKLRDLAQRVLELEHQLLKAEDRATTEKIQDEITELLDRLSIREMCELNVYMESLLD